MTKQPVLPDILYSLAKKACCGPSPMEMELLATFNPAAKWAVKGSLTEVCLLLKMEESW